MRTSSLWGFKYGAFFQAKNIARRNYIELCQMAERRTYHDHSNDLTNDVFLIRNIQYSISVSFIFSNSSFLRLFIQ